MTAFATLPMYDWPETRDANNKLWDALYHSLKDHKIDAPKDLTRKTDPMKIWQDPNLIIGQTCGLPFFNFLTQETVLIGTPAYDIECGAGSYYSVLIVREDANIQTISDLRGKIFGFNSTMSQSGYAAFHYHLNAAGFPGNFWAQNNLQDHTEIQSKLSLQQMWMLQRSTPSVGRWQNVTNLQQVQSEFSTVLTRRLVSRLLLRVATKRDSNRSTLLSSKLWLP